MKKLALTALTAAVALTVAFAPGMVDFVSAATQTGNNTQSGNSTQSGNNTDEPVSTPYEEIANQIRDIFSGSATAAEATEAVSNRIDKDTLAEAMQENKSVLSQMEALEDWYVTEKGITVEALSVSEEAGAFVNAGDIVVIGAGLNADAGSVKLSVSTPAAPVDVTDKNITKSVQLDIQLMNGETAVHDLKFPVSITMKAPAGLDASKLVVLHYTANGVETIQPSVADNGNITFSVTSFSTFVFAETSEVNDDDTTTDDGNGSSDNTTTDNGNSGNSSANHGSASSNNTVTGDSSSSSASADSDVDFQGAVVSVDWSAVESTVNNALQNASGQNVNVFVGKEFEVPASIISKLAGKNVTLALQTGNGLAFSISGTDVKTAGAALNIKMSEKVAIPDDVRKTVLAGATGSRVFGMEGKAAYPYTVNVHVNLGKENAGKMAYLYYYDEATNSMKLSGSFKVTESGQAMFAVSRGDEYIAVVSDKILKTAGNYTVVSGDTLSRIAAKNGVALKALIAANPQIKDSNKIYPGQTITVR